jgi:hypothetical protein
MDPNNPKISAWIEGKAQQCMQIDPLGADLFVLPHF